MNSRPPDGRGGPHVFVDDLDRLDLADDDAHHLGRVVRLRDGDPLTAGDGAGSWRPCVFRGTSLEAVGEVAHCMPASPSLGVGFALIKGGRPELVVQKLTEIGIDTMVPIVCDRSIVRWDDDKAAKNIVRLAKVAREAAMQSRQVFLPTVCGVERFDDAVLRPGATLGERGGDNPSSANTFVLIGPEGGWSEAELAADVGRMRLGESVLRAETAAISAGTLLCALRSGTVRENQRLRTTD